MQLNVLLLTNGQNAILTVYFNVLLLLNGFNTILPMQSNVSLLLNGLITNVPLSRSNPTPLDQSYQKGTVCRIGILGVG